MRFRSYPRARSSFRKVPARLPLRAENGRPSLLLLIIVAFIVAFFALRAVAVWAGIGRNASLAVSAAICLSFLGGALLHPFGAAGDTSASQGQPVVAEAPAASAVPAAQTASVPSAVPLRSLFAGDVASLKADISNAPGAIDEVRVSPDKRFAFVQGWVADPTTKASAHGVLLIVDGRTRFNATPYYGVSRPDVAQALSSPGAARTGYAGAVISLSGLAPGAHVIQSAAVTSDGHYELVAPQHPFTL